MGGRVRAPGLAALLLLPLLLSWTAQAAGSAQPVAVSVTPSSGWGVSQTFSFKFSDGDGYADIDLAEVIINGTLAYAGGCDPYYDSNSHLVYLNADNGTTWIAGPAIGTAGSVQNSQCTVDTGASSASGSVNDLTVNFAITFKPAFTGTKKVFLYADDHGGLVSGWQQLGSWSTSAPAAPSAVSVTPNSGWGTSQVFSFQYSDSNGYADIDLAEVIINTGLAYASGCDPYYDSNSHLVYLNSDSGTAWIAGPAIGTAGTVQNSQCTVDTGASSAVGSTNDLTVNFAITFKPAFTGSKKVFLYADDHGGLVSGWQQRGSWSTSAPAAPAAVSVTPSSGTGTSQTFSFKYSDSNGYADIHLAEVIINSSLAYASGCDPYYDSDSHLVYLNSDSGTTWIAGPAIGTAGTVQNSQCTVDTGASSAVGSTNDLTVNFAITFKPAFTGAKNVYLYADDHGGLASGWQQLGTWTGSNPVPSITSISPTTITATSGDTGMTVNGSNFLAQSVIEVSGIDLTTSFQSATQLTANIPASMLASPGSVPVTVMTPNGGVSNAKTLTISQAVTVSPATKTVAVNWTRLFAATVSGESDQSVTWKVNDVVGGNAATGTITTAGIYISPNTVPGTNVVTVKAVSVANPNKYGTAIVTITLPVSDNYPRSDATSILNTAPALTQVPLQGTIAAVLDWTAKDSSAANEEVSKPEEVLAVCHNLTEMGIPHIHTTDWATAAAYPMVAVAGVLEQNSITSTDRTNLLNYVQNGGTLLLWRPADSSLLSSLGVTASTTFSGTTARQVTFNVATGDGAVRYIDDDVEVHWQMEYWSMGTTREYTAGSATAIATWDSGKAAIARSNVGTGRAYMFGWRLKNVVADAELQNIPGVEPQWVNTQVLDADIARLMVRGIYETLAGSPHGRQMAPNGKQAALILTHDVDAKVSYDNLPQYLALENVQGVKSTYLFTTAAYDSGWVETMYTASGKANIQSAIDQGFDIQSHSFDHYIDFNKAPYGTGNETAANYLPHYSADLGYTINSSALGELGVSRWLLRHDFGVEIPAFRSGYLLMPVNFLQAVQDVGYRRDSTYAAGISRGFTPFVPFKMVNGTPVTYKFVEYPMGLEDRNLDATNVTQIVDSWEKVIRTNYKNGIPTVINIHPVNQPRIDAMTLLFQRIADLDKLWIGDWKTFGDFWESQGMTCSRWP